MNFEIKRLVGKVDINQVKKDREGVRGECMLIQQPQISALLACRKDDNNYMSRAVFIL